MKSKNLVYLVLALTLVMLVACGQRETDWKVYNLANEQFINLATQYEAYYQKQDRERQAVWKEKFDPLFIRGDQILKSWRTVLDAGQDSYKQQQAFLSIKTEIITVLFEIKGGN